MLTLTLICEAGDRVDSVMIMPMLYANVEVEVLRRRDDCDANVVCVVFLMAMLHVDLDKMCRVGLECSAK